MRCWPQLLLAAAVLLLAIDAATANSEAAIFADDDESIVLPGQPIVTVASLNRAPKRGAKQHKRHPGLGRKGHRAELTVSTTQHAGPLARWRAGRKAKQQQKQQADLDHKAAVQAAAKGQQTKDTTDKPVGQAATGKKQKVVPPPVPAIISKTTEVAADSAAELQQKHTGAQQLVDSDTDVDTADTAEEAAGEEEADEVSAESDDSADTDSSSSSNSKKKSAKKAQHKVASSKQGSTKQHTSKPAKLTKAKQQAVVEEADEGEAEEEAWDAELAAEEDAGSSDADGEAADTASLQEDSSADDEQEDSEGVEEEQQEEQEEQEQKVIRNKGSSSSSSKNKKKTASSVDSGAATKAKHTKQAKQGATTTTTTRSSSSGSSTKANTASGAGQLDSQLDTDAEPAADSDSSSTDSSSSSSSSSSKAQPGSAAGTKDAGSDMSWALTRKSKTISLALPGPPDDEDGTPQEAATHPTATQDTAAAPAAVKGSTPAAQQPAKVPGASIAAGSSSATTNRAAAPTDAEANMVLLDDVPESNILEVSHPAQAQAAPAAAMNVNALNAAAAMEAAVNSLGLSFKSIPANSDSSKASHPKVPLLAVSMDGPPAGQDQAATGPMSAAALQSVTAQVVQARDVMLKLAAKPQLLQYVQQKQVRQLADSLDGADVAEISALPGLMGMPKLHRAGDDIDSQLYAKKNALAVAIVMFSHMTPDQLATLLSTVVPEYVTPGVAFEELNKRLYEAPAVEQLDNIYDAIIAKKGSSVSSSSSSGTSSASGNTPDASVSIAAVGRTGNVSKASKVAAYLVLGLLMQGRVLG